MIQDMNQLWINACDHMGQALNVVDISFYNDIENFRESIES
jgi:hypothetical protein